MEFLMIFLIILYKIILSLTFQSYFEHKKCLVHSSWMTQGRKRRKLWNTVGEGVSWETAV